jgi:hypothetical protein
MAARHVYFNLGMRRGLHTAVKVSAARGCGQMNKWLVGAVEEKLARLAKEGKGVEDEFSPEPEDEGDGGDADTKVCRQLATVEGVK